MSHLFHLAQTRQRDDNNAASRLKVNKDNFPLLQGMALYKLTLQRDGLREPHWHPNADELGYCLKGEVLLSLYGSADLRESFLVKEGEAFLIPSGYLHHVENVAAGPSELLLQFSADDPQDFGISSSLGMFSDAVLGNTWALPADAFAALRRSTRDTFAALRRRPTPLDDCYRYATAHRFGLEQSQPLVTNEGGLARMARQNVWPVLQRQALYSLRLSAVGMREPHWHPETAELGYVHRGRGRMSILSPGGTLDTYVMEEGDIYFIPKGYPHHIENLSDGDELHLLIFFDQPMPKDIGFSASVRSYSNEVLAAALGCEAALFAPLPHYYRNLFIVDKVNAVDPVHEPISL